MDDVIRGLWAAVATPLAASGAVDHEALARHCQGLLADGCDGLVLFGTTGEGPSFSGAERLAAVEAVLQAGIPAPRLALGTGGPAIPDTIALARGGLALGLQHILILPPFYFRDAPADGLEDSFAAIIDGIGSDRLRVTLYHIPQVSGVAIPPAVLGHLRTRFGKLMAGVKDSSADASSFAAFREAAPECGDVVGAEVEIARALALGGTGTICGMANVVPGLVRRMFAGLAAEPAMREACNLFNGLPFAPTIKSVLAARTGDAAWRAMRLPLKPLDAGIGVRVAAALATIEGRRAA
jgi:4-hydroxy-tetrahydrodipicolinate synthase